MSILWLLIAGLAAGVVSRRMVPWKVVDGVAVSLAMGIVGAFAGAFVGSLVGYREGEPVFFVTASLGAVGLAFAMQTLLGPKNAT